ncbi:MAG: sodium:proton antiporter [Anaeromyxobacter sp.]
MPPLATAVTSGESIALGHSLPAWAVLPFVLMLLCIAILPLAAGHLWEPNRNKALVSALLGLPVLAWIALLQPEVVLHTAEEYAAFILLLGTLYAISGGVVVRGTLAGTPGSNAVFLAIGAVLASVIGTTGASMVLVRPMLRANSIRERKAHVFVFFIFVVSNAGGLLTPLGDPPLFLGFLRGVPFLWTLRLLPAWLMVNAALLVLFYIVDSQIFRQEDLDRKNEDLDQVAVGHVLPVHVAGKRNLAYLGAVVVLLLLSGVYGAPVWAQGLGLLALGGLSLATTPKGLRAENAFTWGPIVEVAVIFAGIFATMIPALEILNARGAALGVTEPWQFFWASGALSSFLDNAPTYLAFASAASGLVGTDAAHLGELIATPQGATLLEAVALGSVLMGANSYIGNGPNFMVKAIAEANGVRMPSFFGYMAWSGAVLVPLLVAVTFVFMR